MDEERFGLGFVSGQLAGQVAELPENAEVGQSADSGVCVADPALAPRHAQIYFHEGAGFLLDLHSHGGTFLDGAPVVPGTPVPLRPGTLVRFGETGPVALFHSLPVLYGGNQQELVLERTDQPKTWSLSGPVTVGRSETCEIQLESADVLASSEHLHLLPAFGHLIATDLGSVNGTWSEAGRLVQTAIAPGQGIVLGGEGGPSLRLQDSHPLPKPPQAPPEAALASSLTSGTGRPALIPQLFVLELSAGEQSATVLVAAKSEVTFGSFAGINDFETICFPRDLEDESDAMERSEAIGPQHGVLLLGETGVAVRDEGYASTRLDGVKLGAHDLTPLPDAFHLDLGDGALGLRGRLFKHPGLEPRSPAFGVEHNHPVECLTLERMGDTPNSRLYMLLVRQAAIGSSDDAAIRVQAPGVGSLHALLYLQEESLWITQLGPDPVAVDGVPLAPQTTVSLGLRSEVYLGTVRLKIRELR
ncbi:MAG: FHA domain-containing protein [Planctomycetes bacterium]|nr:FHA domain-containing protein [Planctomycetota bacterium]